MQSLEKFKKATQVLLKRSPRMRLNSNASIRSLKSVTPIKRKKFSFKTTTNIDPTNAINSFRKILKQRIDAKKKKERLVLNIPSSLNPFPINRGGPRLSPKFREKSRSGSPKIF